MQNAPQEAREAIRLEGLCKSFGPVRTNRNVSLTVRRGEILALLSENGSGKTTLGIALALKMHFWNIGAEGQIYAGVVTGSCFAYTFAATCVILVIGSIRQKREKQQPRACGVNYFCKERIRKVLSKVFQFGKKRV